MRANWQECKHVHRSAVQWVSHYVTLNRKGVLVMGRRTWEKLGGPSAAQVYFDATNNRFGIKPSHENARNSFKLGIRGDHGGRRLCVLSVMNEFRIDVPQTIQFFDAEIDDEGILVLDLRTARVSNRVLNSHHNRAKRVES